MHHPPKPLSALFTQHMAIAAVIVALLGPMLTAVLAAAPGDPNVPETTTLSIILSTIATRLSAIAAMTHMSVTMVVILGVVLGLMIVRAVWVEIAHRTLVATLIALAVLLPGVAALSTVVLYLLAWSSSSALVISFALFHP